MRIQDVGAWADAYNETLLDRYEDELRRREEASDNRKRLEALYEEAFEFAFGDIDGSDGVHVNAHPMFNSYLRSKGCSEEEIWLCVDWLSDDNRFEE